MDHQNATKILNLVKLFIFLYCNDLVFNKPLAPCFRCNAELSYEGNTLHICTVQFVYTPLLQQAPAFLLQHRSVFNVNKNKIRKAPWSTKENKFKKMFGKKKKVFSVAIYHMHIYHSFKKFYTTQLQYRSITICCISNMYAHHSFN
jgi:hypothetical protein